MNWFVLYFSAPPSFACFRSRKDVRALPSILAPISAHIGRTSLRSAHTNGLMAHFADRPKLSPGSMMPPYKLTPRDLENLTGYLFELPD